MAETTVTVGDTMVEIRETEDGFEAVEVEYEPSPETKIKRFAEKLDTDDWFVNKKRGYYCLVTKDRIPKITPWRPPVPDGLRIAGCREGRHRKFVIYFEAA